MSGDETCLEVRSAYCEDKHFRPSKRETLEEVHRSLRTNVISRYTKLAQHAQTITEIELISIGLIPIDL